MKYFTGLAILALGLSAGLASAQSSIPSSAPTSASSGVSADVGCAYWPRPTAAVPEPELTPYDDCGRERSDGSAEIRQEILEAIDFDSQGLASIRLGGHFYYLNREGKAARVPAWDNWADDFSEGLVRTQREIGGTAKIGYLDARLQTVIAPRFDWGFPFENARALVCLGCRLEAPDSEGHRTISGGLWGYIDRTGSEVVPIRYSREELPERAPSH